MKLTPKDKIQLDHFFFFTFVASSSLSKDCSRDKRESVTSTIDFRLPSRYFLYEFNTEVRVKDMTR